MKVLKNKELANSFSSITDLLDSRNFLSDCINGLEARLDGLDIKHIKTDTEQYYIRYIAKDSPELYLAAPDFSGLVELEKYLKNKYWTGSGKHLSITIWPINKSSINVEISLGIA